MRLRRSLIGGLIGLSAITAGLLAPAATFAASPTPASTVTTTAACTGHWPLSVQGRPTLLQAGAAAGDYLWRDADGWHLRVTHRGTNRAVFTGRIVSSAPMTATPIRLEGRDAVSLSADRLTLTYRFYNYGHLDGIDFKTACAHRLAVSGSLNGVKLPTARIWIGHGNRHPLQNPFAVIRIS